MSNRKDDYARYNAKRLAKIEEKGLVKLQAFVHKETKKYFEEVKLKYKLTSLGEAIDMDTKNKRHLK